MYQRIIYVGYWLGEDFYERLTEGQIRMLKERGLVWEGSSDGGEEFTMDTQLYDLDLQQWLESYLVIEVLPEGARPSVIIEREKA